MRCADMPRCLDCTHLGLFAARSIATRLLEKPEANMSAAPEAVRQLTALNSNTVVTSFTAIAFAGFCCLCITASKHLENILPMAIAYLQLCKVGPVLWYWHMPKYNSGLERQVQLPTEPPNLDIARHMLTDQTGSHNPKIM